MTLHFLLLFVFLLAAGALLAAKGLKVREVRVLGSDRYSPDEVAVASGIVPEDNLLALDKELVEKNLTEKFPYIESVEVRLKLPPAVELTVTQCEPDGAIRQGDDVVLIARDGKVLERGTLMIPEGVPLIKGVSVTGVRPGGFIPEEQKEKLDMLRYLLDAAEESEFASITNVDLTDRLNIKIMYENRILLELGSEAELAHKLQAVQFILENNIAPTDRGTLDATEAHKSRTVFSPTIKEDTAHEVEAVSKEPESTGEKEDSGEPEGLSEAQGEQNAE